MHWPAWLNLRRLEGRIVQIAFLKSAKVELSLDGLMRKRLTLSLSPDAGDQLRALQGKLERRIGFEPSLAQLVEYLIKEYSDNNGDKVTAGHSVDTQ